MKKIIIIATTLLLVRVCIAQSISGGIIGGINTGPVKITDIEAEFTDVIEGENILGYEAGIFAKVRIAPFYIKPLLLYSVKDGEIKYIQQNVSEIRRVERTISFRTEKLEVPLLFGMNLAGPLLSIEAGPVYNYLVDITERYNENKLEVSKNGLGYRAGLASEIGPMNLSASFQGSASFTSTTKATYQEPYKFIFGLGFTLGNSK